MSISPRKDLTIILPVFNDWEPFRKLIKKIDGLDLRDCWRLSILAVNDGSLFELGPSEDCFKELRRIEKIDILHLTRNLGHQRAIAVALAYAALHLKPNTIIVMDSDGEDRPEDIGRLVEKSRECPGKIIFGRRVKRSETLVFRIFYRIYKTLYRVFTGSSISFGNFCLIPLDLLKKVVFVSEIWNHFAAGVVRSKLPIMTVPTMRDHRIGGRSSMNLSSLIIHGMSAIAVHMDTVAVRLLLGALTLLLLSFLGMGFVLGIKFFTNVAIPAWAINVFWGLGFISVQAFLASLLVAFLILAARSQKLFMPQADYAPYVSRLEKIFPFS